MEARFIVTTEDLAEILSLTPRRIQQLAAEGKLPRIAETDSQKVVRGQWYLPAAVRDYVKYKIESESSGSSDELDDQLKVQKLRRATAEADIRENVRDLQAGELYYAADIEQVLTDKITATKAKALAIPAKLTRVLLGQKNAAFINQTLEDAIKESMAEIENVNPADFRSKDNPFLTAGEDEPVTPTAAEQDEQGEVNGEE
jgi:hypothetical protein